MVKLDETAKSTPENVPVLASETSFTARLEAFPGITYVALPNSVKPEPTAAMADPATIVMAPTVSASFLDFIILSFRLKMKVCRVREGSHASGTQEANAVYSKVSIHEFS